MFNKKVIEKGPNCGERKIQHYFIVLLTPADFDKYENFELEKKFHEDQIDQRAMFVSEEIDKEYEENRSLRIAQIQDTENIFQMEIPFIFE